MLSICEGSFHKAQEKKMMDWFKEKKSGKHMKRVKLETHNQRKKKA